VRPFIFDARLSSNLGRERKWQFANIRRKAGVTGGLATQAGDVLDIDVGLLDDHGHPLRVLPQGTSIIGSLTMSDTMHGYRYKCQVRPTCVAACFQSFLGCCDAPTSRRCADGCMYTCGSMRRCYHNGCSSIWRCCCRPVRIDGHRVTNYPSLLRFPIPTNIRPGRYRLHIAVNGYTCRAGKTQNSNGESDLDPHLQRRLLDVTEVLDRDDQPNEEHWPSLARVIVQAPLKARGTAIFLWPTIPLQGVIQDPKQDDREKYGSGKTMTTSLEQVLRDPPCITIQSKRQYHFHVHLFRQNEPNNIDKLTVGASVKSSSGRMEWEVLPSVTDRKIKLKWIYRIPLHLSAGSWTVIVGQPSGRKIFHVIVTSGNPIWKSIKFSPLKSVGHGVLRVGFTCNSEMVSALPGGPDRKESGLVDIKYLFATCLRVTGTGIPVECDVPAMLIPYKSTPTSNSRDNYEIQFHPPCDGMYIVRVAIFHLDEIASKVGSVELAMHENKRLKDEQTEMERLPSYSSSNLLARLVVLAPPGQPKAFTNIENSEFMRRLQMRPLLSDVVKTDVDMADFVASFPSVAAISTILHVRGCRPPPVSKWASFWFAGHVQPIHSMIPMTQLNRLITSSGDQTRVWEISSGRTCMPPLPFSCQLLQLQLVPPSTKAAPSHGLSIPIDTTNNIVCVLGASQAKEMHVWSPAINKDKMVDLYNIRVTCDNTERGGGGDNVAGMIDLDCGRPLSSVTRVLTWGVHPVRPDLKGASVIRCWRVEARKGGDFQSVHMMVRVTYLPEPADADRFVNNPLFGDRDLENDSFEIPLLFKKDGTHIHAMTVVRDSVLIAHNRLLTRCMIDDKGITPVCQFVLPSHPDFHVRSLFGFVATSPFSSPPTTAGDIDEDDAKRAASLPSIRPIALVLVARNILKIDGDSCEWVSLGAIDELQSLTVSGRQVVIIAQRQATNENRLEVDLSETKDDDLEAGESKKKDKKRKAEKKKVKKEIKDERHEYEKRSAVMVATIADNGAMVGARELKFNELVSSVLPTSIGDDSARGAVLTPSSTLPSLPSSPASISKNIKLVRVVLPSKDRKEWNYALHERTDIDTVGDMNGYVYRFPPPTSITDTWTKSQGRHFSGHVASLMYTETSTSMATAALASARYNVSNNHKSTRNILDDMSKQTIRTVWSSAGTEVALWKETTQETDVIVPMKNKRKFVAQRRFERLAHWLSFGICLFQLIAFPFASNFGWSSSDITLLSWIIFRFDAPSHWISYAAAGAWSLLCMIIFFVQYIRFQLLPTERNERDEMPNAHIHNAKAGVWVTVLTGPLLIPIIRTGLFWMLCATRENTVCTLPSSSTLGNDAVSIMRIISIAATAILGVSLVLFCILSIRIRMVFGDLNSLRGAKLFTWRWLHPCKPIDEILPSHPFDPLRPRRLGGARAFAALLVIASIGFTYMTSILGDDLAGVQTGVILLTCLPLLVLALLRPPYMSNTINGLQLALVFFAVIGSSFAVSFMTDSSNSSRMESMSFTLEIISLPVIMVVWSFGAYLLWIDRAEVFTLGKLWDSWLGTPAPPKQSQTCRQRCCFCGRRPLIVEEEEPKIPGPIPTPKPVTTYIDPYLPPMPPLVLPPIPMRINGMKVYSSIFGAASSSARVPLSTLLSPIPSAILSAASATSSAIVRSIDQLPALIKPVGPKPSGDGAARMNYWGLAVLPSNALPPLPPLQLPSLMALKTIGARFAAKQPKLLSQVIIFFSTLLEFFNSCVCMIGR
jgi:cbb3-type cytochrome oxidase subunit 3